jgi:hypothetical protein
MSKLERQYGGGSGTQSKLKYLNNSGTSMLDDYLNSGSPMKQNMGGDQSFSLAHHQQNFLNLQSET